MFWQDVLILMRQPPDESKLHDVARLLYVVKESRIPENLEETEIKVRYVVLFKDLVVKYRSSSEKYKYECIMFPLLCLFRKNTVVHCMRMWPAWFMIYWMPNVSGEHISKI